MRLQTSLHPDRQLRFTWSMSLPSTSTIEQKKYKKSWLPCTPELQTQPSESWISLSLQTLSKETSQMKRKLREMEGYPPLVELQQQITELIREIERIRAKEAQKLEEQMREEAQKLEEQKREDALKVQLESVRAAAAAHPHSSSTTAVSTPPESRHLSLASKIKLEVPKFDGNPLHWFQFWGYFEELIASNTSLTNIEKFTYLNQALSLLSYRRLQ